MARTLANVVVRSIALPNNFVYKILGPKHRIQQNFQIMARGRVAVQIERARRFQHAMQFDEPHRHHGEIGHHVVLAEKLPHRHQHGRGVGIARLHHLVERLLGAWRPVPSIVEGLDLRLRLVPVRRLEKHVIGRVRIERRIEIDEINALVGDVVAQDGEVVAIIERVAARLAAHRHSTLPCTGGGETRLR